MIICNLARILKEQNITIDTLACETGVSLKYIKQMTEDCCELIQLDVLNKICEYLGRTTSQIFEFFPEDIIKDCDPRFLFCEENVFVHIGRDDVLSREQWLRYPMYPGKYKRVTSKRSPLDIRHGRNFQF